jgi:exopolysaccharide production protein ExoY
LSFESVDIVAERASKVPSATPIAQMPGLYRNGLKRTLDVLLVLMAAPFVLIVVLVIAVTIYFEDGRGPFFRSPRIGRHGREFRMLKLRTMVHDAEARLETCLTSDPEAAAEWHSTQKLKADPRITRFGRFLRKSSLDELPQLWNVLTGDMSLIGPRPMMPDQRRIYPGEAYFALRPGVSGPWQVSDRNESTFARRADFDLDYLRTLSFGNDVRLILLTLIVVLRGTGY